MATQIQVPQNFLKPLPLPKRALQRFTERKTRQSLEAAFSKLRGEPVRIQKVEGETCVHESSFHAEHLRIRFKNGESVPVFLKDLNPQNQIALARKIRNNSLSSSYLELRVYQRVLWRVNLGTPQLYSVRWEPARGTYWLFLEDIGGSRLRDSRNFNRWVQAARWSARFHARTRNLHAAVTSFLPVRDHKHYQLCAESVRSILPDLRPRDRRLIEPALTHYVRRLDWFAALPRTVIHGQYFAKNIMLRLRHHDQPLAVIDWETAALGPGMYDLISISSGGWAEDERRIMWRAYFDEYQAETGIAREWEDFCEEAREMELYQALEWLGWWRNRSVSHNFGRWVKELARILRGNPRIGS
ncbi:MAG TPA: aminoglycoside phosphotransferase family protein [Candidatus Bathyarchaeia archaeon]|jgi:hypothetical protein|nr:aminoglycoside phosphotransferase family protein [Candidatus Bathyarchaeia archaeon]